MVLPLFIEAIKDRIDDPVHALDVGEDHHGPGASAHFYKAALDSVGGAQLLPQVFGEGIEVEQFG